MQPQRSLPSLSDVILAIAHSDEDNMICSGMGQVNVWALHPEDVKTRYANRCILPCGDEGHLVQVLIRDEHGERILWVH